MQIDPKDIEQSFEASQAAVTAAEANYKLARDNASRYTALYNSGGVSKAMMEQYNTQMEAAASSLRQAQAQLITNSNQLSYTQLIADHDGVVANVSGEVGQVVAAGTPVVTDCPKRRTGNPDLCPWKTIWIKNLSSNSQPRSISGL